MKEAGGPLRRRALPKGAAFGVVAVAAFLAFASNAAASPLYRVYQAQFRFSAITLTLLFTVYIIVLLGTLLSLGSLSDYVGRRPLLLAGLVSGTVACGLFLLAHGAGLLFAARALQGLSVGLITGAAAAALHDLRPHGSAAPLLSGVAPTAGQALGAIAASLLGQYAPAPTRLIWWLLLAMFVANLLAVLTIPEPGSRRPHALGSLRPRVSVPPPARGAFAAALPCIVGLWALGGFYLSLGPSLAAQLLHSRNLLWGGILIFLLTGLGAAASGALAKVSPTRVMLAGCLALTAGALVTFAAIGTSTPWVLFLGTAIAGLGFGPGFLGAYRATVAVPQVTSDQRAGLITAIYIVSYFATAVPAVIGGITTTLYGVHDTALVYSAAVGVLTATAAVILLARRRATPAAPEHAAPCPEPPPGACTVPACPPNSSLRTRT
ncbi:MFS transporter [Streptomyces sp. NPDC051320]|uniref:MFS transporter n=1 Tax=Streptomyces sp. NPDC051320 TaxID=3154644 RepID=UPI003411F961